MNTHTITVLVPEEIDSLLFRSKKEFVSFYSKENLNSANATGKGHRAKNKVNAITSSWCDRQHFPADFDRAVRFANS
jgi:hypothetical protein